MFAAEGFVVVMPDQFGGDAAPNASKTVAHEETSAGILDKIKLRAAETAKSFLVDMWLARQTPEKVMPILLKVIAHARDEYADAVAHGDGVYCAGYCFGGKYVVMLAGEHPTASKSDDDPPSVALIKAGAVAHATLVTRDDLKAVQAPLSMVCIGECPSRNSVLCKLIGIENDPLFPDEILEEGKKHLATSSVEHEIKVYTGVPHGKSA
jgi:dienelactone hydrolase